MKKTPKLLTATFAINAESVDVENRTISGMVLPYGTTGNTSVGPIDVTAGGIETWEDTTRLKAFSGHNRENPVAYFSALDLNGSQDGIDGITGTITVAATPAGDLALAEAAGKVRDSFSVELDTLVIEEDLDAGTITVVSGFLRAVALVPIPAFDDARVAAVAAAHNRGDNAMEKCAICTHEHEASVSCRDHATSLAASQLQTGGDQLVAGQAAPPATSPPAGPSPAEQLQAAPGKRGKRPLDLLASFGEFTAAMQARAMGMASPDVLAALADITYAAVGTDADQGQWVGELWSGVDYKRKIVPLLGTPQKLTSLKLNGWAWGTKPVMAAYNGNKEDVPSAAVTADPVAKSAKRLAGAHDVDRAMVDFDNPAFWAGYYRAMTNSYAKLSDLGTLADLIAMATDIASPAYEGFLGAIAAGVAAVGDDTGADSTFVIVNNTDLIPWVLGTTNDDLPAKLELIGVSLDRFTSSSGVPAGHVIVGTQESMDFYELGDTPIRVQAVNIAEGGVDPGVFGYYATVPQLSAAVVDVVIDDGA